VLHVIRYEEQNNTSEAAGPADSAGMVGPTDEEGA
jgi:hypothetical protein